MESRFVAQVCRAESLAGFLERANREGGEVTSVGSSSGCSGYGSGNIMLQTESLRRLE